jgi:hypothetical protein
MGLLDFLDDHPLLTISTITVSTIALLGLCGYLLSGSGYSSSSEKSDSGTIGIRMLNFGKGGAGSIGMDYNGKMGISVGNGVQVNF